MTKSRDAPSQVMWLVEVQIYRCLFGPLLAKSIFVPNQGAHTTLDLTTLSLDNYMYILPTKDNYCYYNIDYCTILN